MYAHEPDPTSPLGKLQLRARRVPLWIRVPVLLFAFVAAFATMGLDIPPYSLIVDAQAALFDNQHYPVISIGLTIVCFILPAGLFLQLLAGLFPDNTPPDPLAHFPPPNAGPPPAYMQNSPYAQGLYGQGPTAPHGQAPYGQPPPGQNPYGQSPSGDHSGVPRRPAPSD